MQRQALTIQCPAKVNLALSVGPPRTEDGLHPICSWMVTVGFCDMLTLSLSTDGRSSFDICGDNNSTFSQTIDWPLSSDLAFRAHRLMQEHVGKELPVKVKVQKTIPTGAGLGGGSGDAAGMLTGLNQLFSLGLSDKQLIGLGLRLGSDAGFMVWSLLGKGPAIVSGVGDQIEPLPTRKTGMSLVLILPHVQCATAEVYRAFDRIAHEPSIDPQRVRALVQTWPLDNDALFNDLTEAAFKIQPVLPEMRDQVREATGTPVHISGSGAAMFMVAPDSAKALALSKAITDRTGIAAICAETFPG